MPTRHHAVHRAVATAIAGLAILVLTACSSAVTPPSGDATHFSTGGRHSCAPGASIEIDGQSRTFVVAGHCGAVTVHGDGITVRLDRATTLDVEGQSDTIRVGDRIGSAVVKGNGVALTSASIGAVQVTGQNNSITAPALGSVMVQGDSNAVTTHVRPSDYRATGQNDTLTLR